MGGLRLVLLFGLGLAYSANAQKGFFTPQYTLLDPLTGRTIKPSFDRERFRRYRQLAALPPGGTEESVEGASKNGALGAVGLRLGRQVRPQREIGKDEYQRTRTARKIAAPTYFNEIVSYERVLPTSGQDPEGATQSQKKREGTIRFLKSYHLPNVFDESPTSFTFSSSTSPKAGNGFDFGTPGESFNYGKKNERERQRNNRGRLNSKRNTKRHSKRFERNRQQYSGTKGLGVHSGYSTYKAANTENKFNGNQPAYKWRRKYPYYGRKKRSAQLFSPQLRRQTAWNILDPLTGRPISDSFKDEKQEFESSAKQDKLVLQDSSPSIPHQRTARFSQNFIQGRQSGRYGNGGRPIYRYYKKYPYSG